MKPSQISLDVIGGSYCLVLYIVDEGSLPIIRFATWMIITFLANPVVYTIAIRLHLTTFPLLSTARSPASLVFMLVIEVRAFGRITPTALARTCAHRVEYMQSILKLESHLFPHEEKKALTFMFTCFYLLLAKYGWTRAIIYN